MAQITFFHAAPRSAAELDAQAGAEAILAKARAAADLAGVRCHTRSHHHDRPAEAILEAAQQCHADLIVMASHGLGGTQQLMSSSQTEKVLRRASIPLLVTRVEGNDPQPEASRAVALIQDEHRSLGAVMRGMLRLVEQARDALDDEPGLDHVTLERMLHYVETFPEQLHHPTEEQVLHRLLRLRCRDSHALLDHLEAEHARERELLGAAETALYACPDGATGRAEELLVLHTRLSQLAEHVWRHMRQEERELLPLACSQLHERDWAEIADAFDSHQDPRLGDLNDADFRRLFALLAQLMARSSRSQATPSH
jgi:hemerythrin-like domain-containing protein